MPYKSKRQARYMHWAASQGKIKSSVVEEFDKATDFKHLPERKKPTRKKR